MSNSHALTPEDVLSFKNVDDAQLAPDGTCVAFVVGDSFKTDGKWARSSIWVKILKRTIWVFCDAQSVTLKSSPKSSEAWR